MATPALPEQRVTLDLRAAGRVHVQVDVGVRPLEAAVLEPLGLPDDQHVPGRLQVREVGRLVRGVAHHPLPQRRPDPLRLAAEQPRPLRVVVDHLDPAREPGWRGHPGRPQLHLGRRPPTGPRGVGHGGRSVAARRPRAPAGVPDRPSRPRSRSCATWRPRSAPGAEAFLRAWRRRGSFQGGPGFRAWLYKITMPPHPWCFDGLDAIRPLLSQGLTEPGRVAPRADPLTAPGQGPGPEPAPGPGPTPGPG